MELSVYFKEIKSVLRKVVMPMIGNLAGRNITSRWDLCWYRKVRSCHFELLTKDGGRCIYGENKGHSIENIGAYERLADAVVLTACRDCRQELRKLSQNTNNQDALAEKESTERFFQSGGLVF